MAVLKIMLKDPMTGDQLLPSTCITGIYNEDGTLWTPPVTDLSGYLKTADADKKYAVINHTHTTAQITGLDTSIQSINTEISSLKSSVSSGKATIAAAVTDKGVQTAADATFEEMANNIRNIQTGAKYNTGNATASISGNVLTLTFPVSDILYATLVISDNSFGFVECIMCMFIDFVNNKIDIMTCDQASSIRKYNINSGISYSGKTIKFTIPFNDFYVNNIFSGYYILQ